MATAADITSPRVKVLLFGHSYVRRLSDFMYESVEMQNLGFNPDVTSQVFWCWRCYDVCVEQMFGVLGGQCLGI